MGLDRINSGTGGRPKNVPTPSQEQTLGGAANPMPKGGNTPNGRQAAKNRPTPNSSWT